MRLPVLTSLLLLAVFARADDSLAPSNFPASAAPAAVGVRVAENWLGRSFEWETSRRQHVIYPEVIGWYGALRVAALADRADLRRRLAAKFEFYLTPEGRAHVSDRAHVDYRVFGLVPLELHVQTREPRFLAEGLRFADGQWERTTPDGVTAEARYWIDDMYMILALQAQAFRASGDAKYLDRAALTAVAYLEKLQQPNGLFLHAADSPFYWGRGNGWYAAGFAELLKELPEAHPQHARILAGYRRMMAALLATQTEAGLWRQLVEQPDSWPETSGSGMFAFAFVRGVKRGWLDAATYGPAARKAWLALVAQLDEAANLREVCIGTNKAAREVGGDPAAQRKFYDERPRKAGDLHGQAPLLWTAAALLE